MGLAALLLTEDTQYAHQVSSALANALSAVGNPGSSTYAHVMRLLSKEKQHELWLKSLGDKKIAVIKAIREHTGISLKEAKAVADSVLPTQISIPNPTLAKMKALMEEIQSVGGVAEIV